uniref:Alpha-ketoglutarate-dependent dioxygenase AlkB-like domain-containing protein n=1 Tax=Kalmanozyma brasiliensis (strain GHG001) TaxID=1365824 RepID=V5F0P1_KALBG
MLTQQFTCNYGVAYKHVVAMGTEPLDATSPPVILSTLDLLHARTRSAIPLSQEFNELYPVLYLEHQAMNFHDDGEPGLGPVVSSLSLGSTCRMKFRLKAKHQAQFEGVRPRDRTVLDLPLRHGSVVVQEGHDLQKRRYR